MRTSPNPWYKQNLLMKKQLYHISLALIFIWAGSVAAISFMEAWLKFQAPGITLPFGLGIGKLVFHALNRLEWVYLLLACILLFGSGTYLKPRQLASLLLPFFILILQTTYLLPALDIRADQIIQGSSVTPSKLHLFYVFSETIKVMFLLISGFILLNFKSVTNENYK